jgi:hypothetical protein
MAINSNTHASLLTTPPCSVFFGVFYGNGNKTHYSRLYSDHNAMPTIKGEAIASSANVLHHHESMASTLTPA